MPRKANSDINEDLLNADLTEENEKPVLKEESVDPWKETREIMLPRAPKGEANYLIASVNGRVFKIRRGERVSVPLPIAQVVENSFKDADAADDFIEKTIFD